MQGKLPKFIYNNVIVLSKMREQGEGEIVRPCPTRFATNYLALTSLRGNKGRLRKMFTSDWWETVTFRTTSIRRFVESKVLDQTFWKHLDGVCKVFELMYVFELITLWTYYVLNIFRCALPRLQLDEGKVGKDSKQEMCCMGTPLRRSARFLLYGDCAFL